MKKIKLIICVYIFVLVLLPSLCSATLGNHYLENHSIDITLHQDSSVIVRESMVKVDSDTEFLGVFTSINYGCGDGCKDPYRIHPIKMLSVTDFSGKKIKFASINDTNKHRFTFRVWDLRKVIAGKSDIVETYQIKNSLNTSFVDPSHDIFYRFLYDGYEYSSKGITATIHFPGSITKNNSQSFVDLRDNNQKVIKSIPFEWIDDRTIKVEYAEEITKGQILTLYSKLPKNTLDPYVPTFQEKYADLFERLRIVYWLLPSLGFFIICLIIWYFLGKDFKSKKTIVAEYFPPEKLSLLEIGILMNNCNINEHCLTGEIVSLVNKGHLGYMMSKDEFFIKRLDKNDTDLHSFQKKLLNIFSTDFKPIKSYEKIVSTEEVIQLYKSVIEKLEEDRFVLTKNQRIRRYLMPGSIWFLISVWFLYFNVQLLPLYNPDEIDIFMFKFAFSNIVPSYIIAYLFFKVMPKTTRESDEIIRAIKGYEEYLVKTDKFPELFNQSENRITPISAYATLFGITKKWHDRLKIIFDYRELKDMTKLEEDIVETPV